MTSRDALFAFFGFSLALVAGCAPVPPMAPSDELSEGKNKEAVYHYRRAARTGDGKAANRLGEIYGKGMPGVDLNYAESLKWCYTARALGEEPNCAAR